MIRVKTNEDNSQRFKFGLDSMYSSSLILINLCIAYQEGYATATLFLYSIMIEQG